MSDSFYGTSPEDLDELLGMLDVRKRSKVRFLSVEEHDRYSSLSIERFPLHVLGIDWSNVEKHTVQMATSHAEMASAFAHQVRTRANPDEIVVLMWSDRRVPSVSTPASIVMQHADTVIDTADDVWLYLADENLIIEVYHEGRLTVADVPS